MTTQRTRSLGRPDPGRGRRAGRCRAGHGLPGGQRLAAGQPGGPGGGAGRPSPSWATCPNRAARALVTQRTDSVALVVSESEERVFAEPFFAGIVRGISSGLLETPMQLWLAMAQSPAERERVEHHLTNQHVDGVLLLSLHDADPLPTLLEQRGLPTVLGGRPARMLQPGAQPAYFVDVDNAGGARQAVEYLFGRGRRRIATIAGPQDMGAGLARLAGYRDAVRAAGSRSTEDLIAYGDFSEGSGAAAMRQLLRD